MDPNSQILLGNGDHQGDEVFLLPHVVRPRWQVLATDPQSTKYREYELSSITGNMYLPNESLTFIVRNADIHIPEQVSNSAGVAIELGNPVRALGKRELPIRSRRLGWCRVLEFY